MARYIDLDNPEFPKSYYQGNFGNDDFARGWNTCLDAVIHHQPTADVAPRSEVAREIFGEIEAEIYDALQSNYSVRTTRMKKHPVGYSSEYIDHLDGKIQALRGIGDFIEELKQKYTEEQK